LEIEVVLRELVAQAYEDEYGLAWEKRLPSDLRADIKRKQDDETGREEFDFRTLGALYYLAYGDLVKLLSRDVGKQVAVKFGGPAFHKELEKLQIPRNAIAHSRPVSSVGLQAVKLVHGKLESALTRDGMDALLKDPAVGLTPSEVIPDLRVWVQKVIKTTEKLDGPCDVSTDYARASAQYWWGASALAGFDTTSVDAFVGVVEQYNALPEMLGVAEQRRQLLSKTDWTGVSSRVIESLGEE
jgi:hypothetical protein